MSLLSHCWGLFALTKNNLKAEVGNSFINIEGTSPSRCWFSARLMPSSPPLLVVWAVPCPMCWAMGAGTEPGQLQVGGIITQMS